MTVGLCPALGPGRYAAVLADGSQVTEDVAAGLLREVVAGRARVVQKPGAHPVTVRGMVLALAVYDLPHP